MDARPEDQLPEHDTVIMEHAGRWEHDEEGKRPDSERPPEQLPASAETPPTPIERR